jgi:hypothetical protein
METGDQSPSFDLKLMKFLMDLVGLGRLELPTSRLSGVYSNQLSYRPVSAARLGKVIATPFAVKLTHLDTCNF